MAVLVSVRFIVGMPLFLGAMYQLVDRMLIDSRFDY